MAHFSTLSYLGLLNGRFRRRQKWSNVSRIQATGTQLIALHHLPRRNWGSEGRFGVVRNKAIFQISVMCVPSRHTFYGCPYSNKKVFWNDNNVNVFASLLLYTWGTIPWLLAAQVYMVHNAMNGMAVASLQAIYLQSSPHKNQIRVKNGDWQRRNSDNNKKNAGAAKAAQPTFLLRKFSKEHHYVAVDLRNLFFQVPPDTDIKCSTFFIPWARQ